MGAKGANVQAITQDHDVSIKFPDREKHSSQSTIPNGKGGAPPTDTAEAPPPADGDAPTVNGDGGKGEAKINPRHLILITGRQENAEAAKQALLVSRVCVCVCACIHIHVCVCVFTTCMHKSVARQLIYTDTVLVGVCHKDNSILSDTIGR